jgi:hypothetical protein
MKIFINFNNIKKEININNYISINSIISQYLIENKLINVIDNYFLDYNGLYLNNNYSLEKYNIEENTVLNLNDKVKGGSSFFSYIASNPLQVFIAFIIALLPMAILPLGFIPLTSTLIKVIIESSLDGLGKYLVCNLGKTTLYKRMKIFLVIVKYTIFILMIFVIITFPLLTLCVTLKGHSIGDDPKSMCGGINAGNTAGLVLTMVFVLIYVGLRIGNYVLGFFIKLFGKVNILDWLFNPLLISILNMFNQFKYLPISAMTLGVVGSYHIFIMSVMPALQVFLGTIADVGCKSIKDSTFMSSVTDQINTMKKNLPENIKAMNENIRTNNNSKLPEIIKLQNNHEVYNIFKTENPMCKEERSTCCSPDNFIEIADNVYKILNNKIAQGKLMELGVFPAFILFNEALYEGAIDNMGDTFNFNNKNFEEKKMFLRKTLMNEVNKLSSDTKNLITKFLDSNDEELIPIIEKKLYTNIPKEVNYNKIMELKNKINDLEELMIEKKDSYEKGKSLFKTIFKHLFLNIFCNVVSTANTSQDIISKVGEIGEMVEMLKAGSATGILIAVCYFITFIVLIICGIFNIF